MEPFVNAYEACETLLEDMEFEQIRASSAILRCLRIARLLHDTEAFQWLHCEYVGYPRNEKGDVPDDLRELARRHGRVYYSNGQEKVFFTLASELEKRLEGSREILWEQAQGKTLMDQGITFSSLNKIVRDQYYLKILNAAYYAYALRKYHEITAEKEIDNILHRCQKEMKAVMGQLQDAELMAFVDLISPKENKTDKSAGEALLICKQILAHILVSSEEIAVPPDKYLASDLRLLSERLDSLTADCERGGRLQKAELDMLVLRTLVTLGEVMTNQKET